MSKAGNRLRGAETIIPEPTADKRKWRVTRRDVLAGLAGTAITLGGVFGVGAIKDTHKDKIKAKPDIQEPLSNLMFSVIENHTSDDILTVLKGRVTLPAGTRVYNAPTEDPEARLLNRRPETLPKPLSNDNPIFIRDIKNGRMYNWLLVESEQGVRFVSLGQNHYDEQPLDTRFNLSNGKTDYDMSISADLDDHMQSVLQRGVYGAYEHGGVHVELSGYTFDGVLGGGTKADLMQQARTAQYLSLSKLVGD